MRKINCNFYSSIFWIITGIVLIGLCPNMMFGQTNFLQIEGLRNNHQGMVRFNADGTGPEPAAIGHEMINGLSATYYLSTVDYDSLDPQATSGFSFTGTATGFSNFTNALTSNGFSFSDVTIKLGIYDLGNDSLGMDWWLNGSRETWKLESKQEILIQVNGEDMVGAVAPTLRTVLDFGTLEWSVESDTFIVEDYSANSSVAVQVVAAAFLSDLQLFDSGLKLVRPLAVNTNETYFNRRGKTGYTFDTGVWRIEMINSPTGIDLYSSNVSPKIFELHQNYPNPFNPNTTISFILKEAENVTLRIYNTTGQLVNTLVSGNLEAGFYNIPWNATDDNGEEPASGVYMYQLQAGNLIITKKMLLMK